MSQRGENEHLIAQANVSHHILKWESYLIQDNFSLGRRQAHHLMPLIFSQKIEHPSFWKNGNNEQGVICMCEGGVKGGEEGEGKWEEK